MPQWQVTDAQSLTASDPGTITMSEARFIASSILDCAQMELLKAASQTKEVPFKVAYGLTLTGMRQWGLYISEPRCAWPCPLTMLPSDQSR